MTVAAQQISDALEPLLRKGARLDALVHQVRALKDQGCTQQQTYDALVRLRPTLPPEREDLVLELMDVVVGWCSKADYIWPEPLQG